MIELKAATVLAAVVDLPSVGQRSVAKFVEIAVSAPDGTTIEVEVPVFGPPVDSAF